ncbi:hypothetical protein H5410_049285 [Solanum commersonii]|uniref:Uncharacterized protein n=1 Tax=Solanum commersonii TaxID=4109 RepID=A0A9J5XKN2_SOLCO|nr:hypothetical protein H5410_049285 [Solanum commersonii]
MKKHHEQNTEGVEASLEEIESNTSAIVSFIPQFGSEELRVTLDLLWVKRCLQQLNLCREAKHRTDLGNSVKVYGSLVVCGMEG